MLEGIHAIDMKLLYGTAIGPVSGHLGVAAGETAGHVEGPFNNLMDFDSSELWPSSKLQQPPRLWHQ
jgi:hypothetical protein